MTMKKLGYVNAVLSATASRRDQPASSFQGRAVSWGEVLDQTALIAGGLRALGVGDGDRVAILSANSDLYMALYLAVPCTTCSSSSPSRWCRAIVASASPSACASTGAC